MTAAVIVISPCLGNCDAGLSWRIAVGDIVAGDLSCVICNCILSYRVYNFFSSLIFRQFFEAVGPVSIFVCGYGLAVLLLAVCKKSYSDALRTFAILIVRIVPGLGALHLSCLGCVSVGDVKSVYTCFITFHCFLGYGVGNFLAICIFRQVFKGVGPVSCFVCFYSLACYDLSVCKKVDDNALWTLAILIVCVIPGLGYGDGSCFWSVGVSQSSYSSVLAVVGKFVTFWESFLCPGVLDCFSVCFFRKVRYSLFPIVLDAQGNGLSGFFTVCKKTYGNALRTFSILIFSVVPDLGYCCTGLSWSVAVGDVAAIVGCSVISYFLLSYGVGDFLAVCIFRQIFEGVSPVSYFVCSYGLASFLCAICKKDYSDAFRTLAILVVCIVPGLGSGNLGGLWLMSVNEIIAITLGCVAIDCILSYGVSDFLSVCIFRKVCEAVAPVSVCISTYTLALKLSSVCKKVYGNALWTFSILIICIFPGLGSGDGSKLWSMSVGQSGYRFVLGSSCQAVAFWNINLGPGVGDILSICFFRKTSYRLCPVVRSSKSNSFVSWRSICKESYGNALWTNAILVVSIIPDLGYRRAGLTWGVAVGDVVIIINSCCITRYGKLAYRVGNFLTICIFRQIGEAVGPVIVSCYGLGVCNYAICKKVDGDALWTFAILVVGIVPGFGSGDVEGCWFMSVGDVVAAYACFITSYRILSYCITNFSINIILRQVLEDIVPISSLIRSYHLTCSFCSICKKFYSDTCWSDSVLVVCIIPGLRAADINYSFINVFKSNCINSIITFLDRLAYLQFSVSCICYSYFNSILSSIISNFGILSLNF